MAHLEDIERERRLEKIRGKVRQQKPSTLKFVKPVKLSNGTRLVPLDGEPEGHHGAERQPDFGERLPKRMRADYFAAIGLVARSGHYFGYLEAQRPEGSPAWAWWRPDKRHAGTYGDTLLEALDRVALLTPTAEDVKAVEKLEHAYRVSNPPREGW